VTARRERSCESSSVEGIFFGKNRHMVIVSDAVTLQLTAHGLHDFVIRKNGSLELKIAFFPGPKVLRILLNHLFTIQRWRWSALTGQELRFRRSRLAGIDMGRSEASPSFVIQSAAQLSLYRQTVQRSRIVGPSTAKLGSGSRRVASVCLKRNHEIKSANRAKGASRKASS
jgi:hypothetical protein